MIIISRFFLPIVSYYRNIPIKRRIFISSAVVITLALFTLALITNIISTNTNMQKASKNAQRELTLVEKNILNMVNAIESFSKVSAMDNRLQNELAINGGKAEDPVVQIQIKTVISSTLSYVKYPATMIRHAGVMTNGGIFITGDPLDESSIYRIFDRVHLNQILNRQKPVWSGLMKLKYSNGSEENVFAVSKAVIHVSSGETLGMVILFVNEREISSIYQGDMVDKDDRFLIVDGDEQIISSQDKSDLYHKFDASAYNKGYLSMSGGIERLGWKLVSLKSMKSVVSENQRNTWIILVVGVFCLAVAFVVSYILSYTISKPILKLVRVMNEIKQDRLETRVDFTCSDEIGMLGKGFNNLMDRVTGLMDDIYREQRFRRESELKLLQYQVKPHFLYNTLETIISFILLDMKDNAIKAAESLADFYRLSLSRGKEIITIGEEAKLTVSYLSILKFRYAQQLDFKVDFDEEIMKCRIPKLTLQPLVENSIYHGLKPKERMGFLSVKGCRQEDYILIEVFDDGVGIPPDKIESILKGNGLTGQHDSFGAASVDARLKLFYGERFGLHIDSEAGKFTRVSVYIPMVES